MERACGAAVLDAALELPLACRRLGQEPADRVEVLGPAAVRRRGDREVAAVEVLAGVRERQGLERLRGRAQESHERRIAGRRDDLAVTNGDGMDDMARFDRTASPDLDSQRLHAWTLNEPCEWSGFVVWSGYVDH